MKMRAGLKLCGKNPTHMPTVMIAISGPRFGGVEHGCRSEQDAARLEVAREQRVEDVEQARQAECTDEADEQRDATDVRRGPSVHGALVRLVQPTHAVGEATDEWRGDEGDDRRGRTNDEIGAGGGHECDGTAGPRSAQA
jgi:hypothetical protein